MRDTRPCGLRSPVALAVVLLMLGPGAHGATAMPDASTSVEPAAPVLRGVVGRTVYVALPALKGYAWEWAARGERWLFGAPYKVSFVADPQPTEIWTFPLTRPGRALLDFVRRPVEGPSTDGATHSIKLWVMTPYEAQQHAPAELRDTLLVR